MLSAAVVQVYARRSTLMHICFTKGIHKGGGGLGLTPLEFDMLQKLYYLCKEIHYFCIDFLVNLST